MDQRGRTPPVLERSVGEEHFRDYVCSGRAGQDAVRHAIVGLIEIGEGKNVHRVEEVGERLSVPGRLGEALVETAATGAAHVRPERVEGAPVLLVGVEAIV